MAKTKTPITSTTLTVRFQTASHVIGLEETHLVFPAIEFGKKSKPPSKSLNPDPKGPSVVQVDVHEANKDEVRRGSWGYAGVERLTLFLPPEPFEDWVKQLKELGRAPMEVAVTVDEAGNIERLSLNDVPVRSPLSSDTRELTGGAPSTRTGTD